MRISQVKLSGEQPCLVNDLMIYLESSVSASVDEGIPNLSAFLAHQNVRPALSLT
jgi:hypothetical protein